MNAPSPYSDVGHIAHAEGMREGFDFAAEKARLLAQIDEVASTIFAADIVDDSLAAMLGEAEAMLDRFMSMSAEQRVAVVLWIAHTYVVDVLEVCAYLFLTSAEKRCGKSLLLDLIYLLVCRGLQTMNISTAALYRVIEERKPTLLFDEVDQFFGKGKGTDPAKAELVGLINAGFRRGAKAIRMGGAKMAEVEEFDAYGPKALAGIGGCLPDTTEDRTIPIRLERKARADVRDRYRVRLHEEQVRGVGARLGVAVREHLDEIAAAYPKLPDELSDRAQDIWEGLFAIADAAGGDWPHRARQAAVKIHTDREPTVSQNTRLLADIEKVFISDKLLTKDLVAKLNDLEESPWGEWAGGKGITSSQLVTRLKTYGLTSKPMRAGGDGRGRGFDRAQFLPVFERYLDPTCPLVDTVDTVDNSPKAQVSNVNTSHNADVDATVDAPEQGKRPLVHDVNTVNGWEPDEPVDEDSFADYID